MGVEYQPSYCKGYAPRGQEIISQKEIISLLPFQVLEILGACGMNDAAVFWSRNVPGGYFVAERAPD